MSTKLITDNLWPTLTNAVRSISKPCYVAVAYFGQGGSKLLPLTAGSRLVVDASERAVKSGQTCPDELLKLQRKGVEIFTVNNLHAKVFVVGRTAFVGSANVSSHSANTLVETALQTTDAEAAADARQFVRDHCLVNLGPERLKELAEIYRPPHIPGGGRKQGKPTVKNVTPEFNDVYLALVDEYDDFPEEEKDLRDAGLKSARRERRHRGASHEIDEVRWQGRNPFKPGQLVIQVFKEKNGKTWIYPPAFVLSVVKHSEQSLRYFHVERPRLRRYSIETVASRLGRGTKTRLRKSGRVADKAFAWELLRIWHF